MSKPMPTKKAIKICDLALKVGLEQAGKSFGISKERVRQIFSCHKSRVLFSYELYDKDGKERNFNELRKVYNSWDINNGSL
jgi:hypothetical protein